MSDEEQSGGASQPRDDDAVSTRYAAGTPSHQSAFLRGSSDDDVSPKKVWLDTVSEDEKPLKEGRRGKPVKYNLGGHHATSYTGEAFGDENSELPDVAIRSDMISRPSVERSEYLSSDSANDDVVDSPYRLSPFPSRHHDGVPDHIEKENAHASQNPKESAADKARTKSPKNALKTDSTLLSPEKGGAKNSFLTGHCEHPPPPEGELFEHPPPSGKLLGEPIIIVRGISKSYDLQGGNGKVVALKRVNLCNEGGLPPIRRGEFVMIRGPSGGGKTTLLNLLGTIDYPTTGEVEVCGERISRHSTDAALSSLRLNNLGFVFQTFNLLPTLSAFENVELPMILQGKLGGKARKLRATELLRAVGLQDRMAHLPSELSGGEMQRTAIARALANEPMLLLLDEPTGDLDTKNTIEVMDLLLQINRHGFASAAGSHRSTSVGSVDQSENYVAPSMQSRRTSSGKGGASCGSSSNIRGTTCVMVTHNPDLECYADRILYVDDGQFEKQIFNREQRKLKLEPYLKYLSLSEAPPAPDVFST